MIILDFHLQPQFKKELFHKYFTSFHSSREIWTQLISLLMCGFKAQLVEQRTGNAEVTGSNPVEALIFFQASSFQLLKLENLLRWSFFTFICCTLVAPWTGYKKIGPFLERGINFRGIFYLERGANLEARAEHTHPSPPPPGPVVLQNPHLWC